MEVKKMRTGDAFVDLGLMAIRMLTSKEMNECSKKELKKIADDLVELYLTKEWASELYSIFPNSKYINSKNKKSSSTEFLYRLIDELDATEGDRYCIFCGAPTNMKFVKTEIPLVGSSKFVNFFPAFKNGIDACAKCTLAIQFAPLLFYKVAGKPVCISANDGIMQMFVEECSEYLHKNRLQGIFNEGFKYAQNALFHLAYKTVEYSQKQDIEYGEITMYHIDNFNQNPAGIMIYKLPNNIFQFVFSVINNPEYKKDWYNLLNRHYITKKDKTPDGTVVWKVSSNRIYNRLLKNESILWAFKDDNERKALLPWAIIERYLELVRDMNTQRVEAIKKLADNIAVCIEESTKKKRVTDIIGSKDFASFRNQIRLVYNDWRKLEKDTPMITFDDYATVMITDANWREIKDLIVIRLYEKLEFNGNKEENKEENKNETKSKKGE